MSKLRGYCEEHTFCQSWREAISYVWFQPFMMKWGRLGILFTAMISAGIFFHVTGLQPDTEILLLVIMSWTIGLAASIATTHVYGVRGLGIFGTIVGDITLYSGVLVALSEVGFIEQATVTNFARGAFVVSAPLFAYGVVKDWRKDRKARDEFCGEDKECKRRWGRRERRDARSGLMSKEQEARND
jgi:hypothetical protein